MSSAQDNERADMKLGCVCMQGLVGSVPNLGRQISSKMSSLSLQGTSLVQCNATHLSALQGVAKHGQVPLFGALSHYVNSSCKNKQSLTLRQSL